jgi:hypothetical protein
VKSKYWGKKFHLHLEEDFRSVDFTINDVKMKKRKNNVPHFMTKV